MCVDIEKFLFYFLFHYLLSLSIFFVLRIEFLVDERHHKYQNRSMDVLVVVINGTGA